MEPRDVLAMLNRVFALFDDLCDSHGAYKLEIIVSVHAHGSILSMFLLRWHAPWPTPPLVLCHRRGMPI